MLNKLKCFFIIAFIAFISASLLYAQDISFSAGKTDIKFVGETKSVELRQGANIKTNDIEINAESVNISGEDFSQINCNENVNIVDYKHNISIYSTSLSYDRKSETIIIDGWVELQDLNNKVAASAAWMEFDMKSGILELQIRSKILKETSKGIMICRADTIQLNRENNSLTLIGNANIIWNEDEYNAATIQVDLEKENIKMIGKIKGKING